MKKPLPCIYCQVQAHPKSIKNSFLGFPKFICSKCGKKNLYPASIRSKILYWILASIFVVLFLGGLVAGQVIVPGIIFIAGFWGIFANMKISKEHQRQKTMGAK
jgi:hypothetical protein